MKGRERPDAAPGHAWNIGWGLRVEPGLAAGGTVLPRGPSTQGNRHSSTHHHPVGWWVCGVTSQGGRGSLHQALGNQDRPCVPGSCGAAQVGPRFHSGFFTARGRVADLTAWAHPRSGLLGHPPTASHPWEQTRGAGRQWNFRSTAGGWAEAHGPRAGCEHTEIAPSQAQGHQRWWAAPVPQV